MRNSDPDAKWKAPFGDGDHLARIAWLVSPFFLCDYTAPSHLSIAGIAFGGHRKCVIGML
jgi:hypothetical protein